MWDIVWISPQEHRSVSVRCQAVRERQQRVKSKATTTFANASSPICHMNLAICCRRSRIAHNMSSLYGYLNTLLAAVDDWSAGVKLPLLTTLTESLWRPSLWPCHGFNTLQLVVVCNQAKTSCRSQCYKHISLWRLMWNLVFMPSHSIKNHRLRNLVNQWGDRVINHKI